MSTSPSEGELMDLAAEEALFRCFTALTGKVTEYDAATRTATVQPLTKRAIAREDGTLSLESLPPLPSVIVIFPMAGPFSITFPIEVGTVGLLLVLSDSDHIWRETQIESEPGDLRRFSLSCTRFLPGYLPDAVAHPAAATAALVVKGSDVRLGDETASDFVALASKVDTELTKLWAAVLTLKDSTATLVTTSSPYVAAPVAATLVKAK